MEHVLGIRDARVLYFFIKMSPPPFSSTSANYIYNLEVAWPTNPLNYLRSIRGCVARKNISAAAPPSSLSLSVVLTRIH